MLRSVNRLGLIVVRALMVAALALCPGSCAGNRRTARASVR
jgi:hypothetical protein